MAAGDAQIDVQTKVDADITKAEGKLNDLKKQLETLTKPTHMCRLLSKSFRTH